jgi:adenylate cyclase class 2
MIYEVELKFPLLDVSSFESKLSAAGATLHGLQQQQDRYFAHPARDFEQSDEALRIRWIGPSSWVTYKGPRVDAKTKTRAEIELPLEGGLAGAERFAELLQALGFRPVADVRKRRRPFTVAWQGWDVAGALDQVETLGTFVELELAVGEIQVPAAQNALHSLAAELGLVGAERRSYMELLRECTPRLAGVESSSPRP